MVSTKELPAGGRNIAGDHDSASGRARTFVVFRLPERARRGDGLASRAPLDRPRPRQQDAASRTTPQVYPAGSHGGPVLFGKCKFLLKSVRKSYSEDQILHSYPSLFEATMV